MTALFGGCYRFNQPVGNWNVSKVSNVTGMFSSATSYNQNLSTLYFSNVKAQPTSFSAGANTQWIANRATQFPKANISGTPTTIST